MVTTFAKSSLIVVTVLLTSHSVWAAITTTGDVAPAPPATGGPVVGPFRVGNTSLGTMSIAGGTALTSSNNAFVGDASGGLGVVTMDGFGSNWTLTTAGADLSVGVDGTGSVSLSNFARMTVPDDTVLGDDPTGIGEIIIADLGSVWTTGNLFAGDSGLGVVNIFGGGQLLSGVSTLGSFSGSEGRVTISDALSLWRVEGGLTLGAEGRATVSIFDGGTLRTTSVTSIGNALASVGKVEVNGAGALWNSVNSGVVLGSTGTGRLHVFNGGRVSLGQALALGSNTGSRGELLVDGLDSTLTTATQITTGAGEANVTISNGGVVSASSIPWGSNGRLTLNGGRLEVTGSGITNQGLVRGHGTIDSTTFNNQQNGSIRGRLQVGFAEHLLLNGALTNTGFVDVDGGELEVLGATTNNFDIDARNGATLRVGATGLDNNSGAQLSISGGAVDVFGAVDNNLGGEIAVVGGATAVFHDTVTNNGNIFVSPSSQIVMLEDLGFSAGAALSIHLAAIDPEADPTDGFGQAITSGQATLAGALNVSLVGGYMPELGSTFQIVSAGEGRSGTFATESLPALAGGLGWDVVYSANAVALAVVPALLGDYNVDGIVDAADYVVWRKTDGTPAGYELWRANFGRTAGSGSHAGEDAAVPEPVSALLLILAATVASCRRPRIRSRMPSTH